MYDSAIMPVSGLPGIEYVRVSRVDSKNLLSAETIIELHALNGPGAVPLFKGENRN